MDVTDPKRERRVTLHAPETPEIVFQDFGSGRLENGRAHIDLDPRLAGSVTIDAKHPLRVFIQLEEDENVVGVVVKNKTATGFDVVERLGGRSSNAPFQWQVVANRADEVLPSGRVSRNADARFEEHAPPDRVEAGKGRHPDAANPVIRSAAMITGPANAQPGPRTDESTLENPADADEPSAGCATTSGSGGDTTALMLVIAGLIVGRRRRVPPHRST